MKLIWAILFFIPFIAGATPQRWRQFQLKIISKENVLKGSGSGSAHASCTGTLLNMNGKCALITNAHCIKRDDDFVLLSAGGKTFPEYQYDLPLLSGNKTSQYDFFYNSVSFVAVTRVKKRFITKDLAELKVSEELRSQFCEDLSPVNSKILSSVESKPSAYAALGFFMGVETVSFTGDKAWARWKEEVKLVNTDSSLNLKTFYHIPKLTTYRGMSGGLLINKKLMPVGILTRHIPYQEESFAIGLDEVEKFLEEEKEPESENPEIFFSGNRLINRGEVSAENEQDDSGNEHGNGGNEHGNGGNEHGNGGNEHGNGSDQERHKKPLSSFRLPREGVLDPQTPKRLLINACGQQIDGYEDFVRSKTCEGEKVYRPLAGNLSDELRAEIRERLLGDFSRKVLSGTGTKILFFEQANFLDGWRKFAKGTTSVVASVDPNSVLLRFRSEKMFRLFDAMEPPKSENNYDLYLLPPGNGNKIKVLLRYAAERPSASGKGTVYTDTSVELDCENQDYLKLICSDRSDQFEFSLSKRMLKSDTLKYRLTHRTGVSVSGHEVAVYYYGELKIDEKGKLSDLPRSGEILPGLR